MNDTKRDPSKLKLVGGRLCLDFVNTLDWRGREDPGDYLTDFQNLVLWSHHAGSITPRHAEILLDSADRNPSKAKKILKNAHQLREAAYQIFTAVIEDQNPAKEDLAIFNKYVSQAMKDSRIVQTQEGFRWDASGHKPKLRAILYPIIRSAADLLVSEKLERLKSCDDPICGWLFFDTSRNHSRRWCDMKDCGNRAKASRFYHRKKKSGKRSSPHQNEF
jgi:predicted RNA-binding Zn ribbon-like protein